MHAVLTDDVLRKRLATNALDFASQFSWDNTAKGAWPPWRLRSSSVADRSIADVGSTILTTFHQTFIRRPGRTRLGRVLLMKWIGVIVLAIIGILAAIVAVEYLTLPIHSLPSMLGGKTNLVHGHHVRGHYHKRGYVSLVIAISPSAVRSSGPSASGPAAPRVVPPRRRLRRQPRPHRRMRCCPPTPATAPEATPES